MARESRRPVDTERWNALIAKAKLRFSAEAGNDIGVPYTVRRLLERKRELLRDKNKASWGEIERELNELRNGVDYKVLVGEYLFWADLPDGDGINPADGELRRYVHSKTGLPFESGFKVNRLWVERYLTDHGLPAKWLPELMARVDHLPY
jgi:hypothetical protein